MVETLEHLIRRAATSPTSSRKNLYRELLRSDTFLLTLDAPLKEEQVTRISRPAETFPIWADKDPEMGGVWVPVFPSRDSVSSYVAARDLRASPGKEFLWMGHSPGAVFPLLRGVKCFAGIRLYLDEGAGVAMTWAEVKALSEGRVPSAEPELYELPLAKLTLPMGLRLAFGRVNAGPKEPRGKLLCLPDAGRFRSEDIRRLVRLELGPQGSAWMPCRHFLQVLRFLRAGGGRDSQRYIEDLLCSLVGFQMFGEAEALCEWLARKGEEAYAWTALAVVYAKTGKLAECVALCRRGAVKYPREKSFPLSAARALIRLGRPADARRLLEAALKRFPGEPRLLEVLRQASQ